MNPIGAEIELDRDALDELEASFRGALVRPADLTYDEHRKVWNGSIDRHPALIARCTGVADVIAAVRFARNAGLVVAVRGGGHSYPGHSVCDGGILIDLGPMRESASIRPPARQGLKRACFGVSSTARRRRSG